MPICGLGNGMDVVIAASALLSFLLNGLYLVCCLLEDLLSWLLIQLLLLRFLLVSL